MFPWISSPRRRRISRGLRTRSNSFTNHPFLMSQAGHAFCGQKAFKCNTIGIIVEPSCDQHKHAGRLRSAAYADSAGIPTLNSLGNEVVVVRAVEFRRICPLSQLNNVRRQRRHELAIVADEYQGTFVSLEGEIEPTRWIPCPCDWLAHPSTAHWAAEA